MFNTLTLRVCFVFQSKVKQPWWPRILTKVIEIGFPSDEQVVCALRCLLLQCPAYISHFRAKRSRVKQTFSAANKTQRVTLSSANANSPIGRELSFKMKDSFKFMERYDEHWLLAEDKNGQTGYIPATYVVVRNSKILKRKTRMLGGIADRITSYSHQFLLFATRCSIMRAAVLDHGGSCRHVGQLLGQGVWELP